MSNQGDRTAVCTTCRDDPKITKPFRVPYPLDRVGVALMKQHLLEAHGIKS